MTLKYIIILIGGLPLAVVFDPILSHREIAGHFKALSAGFCCLDGDKAIVWGGSVTLDIKSKPEDAEILSKFIQSEY